MIKAKTSMLPWIKKTVTRLIRQLTGVETPMSLVIGKGISWLREVPLSNSRRTDLALNIYLPKASNDFQEKTLAFKKNACLNSGRRSLFKSFTKLEMQTKP